VRLVLDYLAGGMNGMQAAAASGVSKSTCYQLLHSIGGVSGRLLIAIAAQTTAAATLGYYLLERPAQRLRPRRK
jgi:peptidoglycan/LPS O-acetylase OafA/YrhL